MKKLFLSIFLGISFLFFANYAAASLVPCGGPDDPCQLCDIFVMLSNIMNFIFFKLVPPIAALMLVIGGVMFLTGAGNPSQIEQGRKIMTSVTIGLIIIYGAWLLIGLFFSAIGVAEWTGLREGWFQINCPAP